MANAAEAMRVVVIHGDPEAAAFLRDCLQHPQVEVRETTLEEINGAMRDQHFPIAIVGGTVGSRGPLVMCEAVRMGRDAKVLVLTDRDVSSKAVEAHRGLGIAGVSYVDFDAWKDPAGDLKGLAYRLRSSVLEHLGATEDAVTADAARQKVGERQATREAERPKPEPKPAAVAEAQVQVMDAEPLEEVDAEPSRDGAPPPFLTQLIDEDVEFANRLAERSKGIDFRAAPPPLPPPQDSADAKALKLRERVRDLERQLARLAFVYRSRRKQFDQTDTTLATLKQSRALLEGQIQQLQQEHMAANQQREAAIKQREHEFGAMLAQAEQAFSQLKEQSAQTIANLQQQLAGRQAELQTAAAENQQLRQHLDSARMAQDSAAASREELVTNTLERERAANERVLAAEQKHAQEREVWVRERVELEAQVDELTGNCSRYAEQLAESRARIEEIEQTAVELESQLQNAQRERQEEMQELQRRMERMAEDHRRELDDERRRAQEEILSAKTESAARVDQMRRMTESQHAEGQSAALAQIAKLDEEYSEKIASLEQQLAEQKAQFAAEKKEIDQAWSVKVDKLKESATVFRDAHQEAENKLKDREATIGVLEGRLEERAREIEHLMASRDDGGTTQVFEARLRGLEEAISGVATQVSEQVAERVAQAVAANDNGEGTAAPDLGRLEATLAQLESRLANAGPATSGEPPPALLERLDRLEQALREGGVPTAGNGEGMSASLSDRLAAIEAGLASLGAEGVGGGDAGLKEMGALAARLDRWEEQLDSLRGELGRRTTGQTGGADPRAVSAWEWVRATPERGIIAAATVALITALVVGLAVAAASGGGDPVIADAVADEGEAPAADAAAEADAPEEVAAVEEGAAAAEPADEAANEGEEEAKAPEAEEPAAAPAEDPNEPTLVEGAPAKASLLPAPKGGGSEATRKELRKKMLGAFAAKRYPDAVSVGLQLRNCCRLDWEAHLRLAEAMERSKKMGEALELYEGFVQAYPTNAFADEVMFRLGSMLLTEGKKGAAKPWLEKVAANEESKHRKKAQAMLKKL